MHSTWTTRLALAMGALLLVASACVAIVRTSTRAPTGLSGGRSTVSAKVTDRTEAEAALAPRVLLSDNFEDDAMGADPPTGWTVADGRWNGVISNDTHVVQHAAGAYGQMVAGSMGWTDYTVSADVMPTPLRTSFAAVAGRYQDRGDYYQCDIHHAGALCSSGAFAAASRRSSTASRWPSTRPVSRTFAW